MELQRQADLITYYLKEKHQNLYNELVRNHEFIAATAHKFQGDERDVIIFSPVVSNGSPQGTLNFLSSTPNLFNVAITRARASLIIVGNKSYCQNNNIHYLVSFANYTESLYKHVNDNLPPQFGREYPDVKTRVFVPECERQLYAALYDKGLQTIPQYEVDKYHIDLALIEGSKRLAIEVGEDVEYNGEQSYAIHLRNTRLNELGWKIIRFQPYQIRDNLEWCISQITSMQDSL